MLNPTKKRGRKAAQVSCLIPGQDQINWAYETQRIISHLRKTQARVAYIDLFCGFGGTTAGVSKAKNKKGKNFATVILGINHDDIALACHKLHNPHTLHLREDIRNVALEPIAAMVAAIRRALPYIKIKLWTSAECTHHSKAKGGDSRDPDSRSLAEELYRYEAAIKPDMIQVENVTEFRTWGPLMQKQFDVAKLDFRKYRHKLQHEEYGLLLSKNKKKQVWITKTGMAYKKDKKRGICPWMVPIPERKAEYFNEWKNHLISLGYTYEDKDINAADHGAFTARIRYYGQFSKGMPIIWPGQTHCKDPEKHFLKFGHRLLKHKAVKEVLDFSDTGESIFVPGRIKSDQTFKRVVEGAIKHIAGGKANYAKHKADYEHWLATGQMPNQPQNGTPEDFLVKYNSSNPAENDYQHSVVGVDKPAPTVVGRNMLYKPHFNFMTKYFGGDQTCMNFSIDDPASSLTVKDRLAKVNTQFLPFIIQFNNNADLNSVEDPSRVLTQRDKFGMASFIHQRNGGHLPSKNVSVDGPARTVTQTGGNQDLVQVQQILPYIYTYHGTSDNSHAVDKPAPTVPAADTHALATMWPFIFRQFSGGGALRSVNDPAGALLAGRPKMNLCQAIAPKWLMETHFDNVETSIDGPAKVITADRHYAYIVNPSYFGHSTSVENSSPVVVARQDKAPLHLAQVEYGENAFYGIIIYQNDSPEVRELKFFMAMYGIIDIKMRMLKEMELLPIQGFPPDYIEVVRAAGIKVTGTNAKKYIGNSQEVTLAQAIAEGYVPHLDFKTKYKNAA